MCPAPSSAAAPQVTFQLTSEKKNFPLVPARPECTSQRCKCNYSTVPGTWYLRVTDGTVSLVWLHFFSEDIQSLHYDATGNS
jgi:hypothetical protein